MPKGKSNKCIQAVSQKRLGRNAPYVPGEDLLGVSISEADAPPNDLGMIVRNPKNHADQWYVAKKYVENSFEPAGT